MPRATNNVASRKRRKRVLKAAKGYRGARSRLFQNAKETVRRALRYAYRDRRQRRRNFRALWITRINALSRRYGLSYSRLIEGLDGADIAINRKILADLAVHDVEAFAAIVEQAKSALGESAQAAAN
jgi:large subunit ribosomal protein L20